MNDMQLLPRFAAAFLVAAALSACGEPDDKVSGRWYTETQVERGVELFARHCAVCHGEEAEGTDDWMRRDAQGNLPPPPLNGSAHAWHHPLAVLLSVINTGGQPYGGVMPPFQDALTDAEKLAVIAWFQDKWSDEIYARWEEIEARAR